jgi:hypothetical protein
MKTENENEIMKVFKTFARMTGRDGYSMFGGNFQGFFDEEPIEKYPYQRIGDGYELRPIELRDKKGNKIENDIKYSHLYHNELKVTDKVFRAGGSTNKFKDGYIHLIYYKPSKTGERGFDSGTHTIVNQLGDICLGNDNSLSYPSHCGGNLAKLKDTYYDLRTGTVILTCSSSESIDGKNFVIINHRYGWYDKNLPLGIYRIDKFTCEYEKIDETKR